MARMSEKERRESHRIARRIKSVNNVPTTGTISTAAQFGQSRPNSTKRRIPDEVWQDGAYLDDSSVGAAKLTFNPAVAGHTHGWGDLPNGMSWGKVDQQDFFRVLDRRYRRLR